ncbi:MAG: hypothetical protein ACRD1K_05585 [Acidimicrobiales bacterium]
MTMTLIQDDDQLLARLAGLTRRIDPVPSEVTEAARGSYAWRTLDLDLAELLYDSCDEGELVGVRSGGDSRQLTFQGAGMTVEMEVSLGGGLVGQIVPPQPAGIEVRHGSSVTALVADHLGRFATTKVPPGPVSLHVRPDSGARAVATDWLVI